jgi:DNA-binding LacI/PurR family transcriptional regulator
MDNEPSNGTFHFMNYTMKDVAKVGGISLGTVSNVLNELPTVTEKNRKKVLDAIQQLDYSPNFTARALRTRRSRCVGLIIPDINNPFYSEFARGVEDSVQAMGYNLFLCNSDRNSAKERSYMDTLLEKTVDGLILFKTHVPVEEIGYFNTKYSIVLVDSFTVDRDLPCDIIKVDDYNGVMKALEYLWNFNHRKIAMIAGTRDSLSSLDRVRSYNDFFAAKGRSISKACIEYGNYDWHSGYDCTKKILDGGSPPTAIIAANDLMAIGAMKAVQERGLTVPSDISVMGYDDIDIASLCTPALTTVRQPKYKMGECSVQYLLNRIENKEFENIPEPKVTTFDTEIIERYSVSFCKEAQ